MSLPIPSLKYVVKYFNRENLIQKVIEQIKKDFNWFSYNIILEGKEITPYLELFHQILPIIDDLLNDNYTKLLSLLYRIDIEEDFLNKKLKENQHADTAEIITDLIIKRALQKVIIREMYNKSIK